MRGSHPPPGRAGIENKKVRLQKRIRALRHRRRWLPDARPTAPASPPGRDRAEGEEMSKHGTKWTAEEDDRLLELKAAGKSLSVIAKELNRTQAAVDSRTSVLKRMKGAQ